MKCHVYVKKNNYHIQYKHFNYIVLRRIETLCIAERHIMTLANPNEQSLSNGVGESESASVESEQVK